jgi:hypothetical protein
MPQDLATDPLRPKQDLPALDLCDAQQPHRRPGIVRESGIDFLLAFGIDDQQEAHRLT